MKIVQLDQRTPQWFEWRAQGIGASEISALLGEDEYKTPYQLWEEKCAFAKGKPVTQAMRHGIVNEDVARNWINTHEDMNLKPLCCEDEDDPIFKASLDGWDEHRRILVEIKCPLSEANIDAARENSSIPTRWYNQVQWQMMITEAESAYVAVWDYRAKGCVMLRQWANRELWDEMRRGAKEFWQSVVAGKAPELEEKDRPEITSPDLSALLLEYGRVDKAEKALSRVKKELKNKITTFGGGCSFTSDGYTVSFVPGRTSYDYQAMQRDGLDLSPYAKTGQTGFRITVPKENV